MPSSTAYQSLLVRVRSLSRSSSDEHERLLEHFPRRSRMPSLESFMSFGTGSGINGATVTTVICANYYTRLSLRKNCPRAGTVVCQGCYLVKYCSEKCQKSHWPNHRSTCLHPYLDEAWQPSWVAEGRDPIFLPKKINRPPTWNETPVFDSLNLPLNEGFDAENMDFSLCFVASGDISGLVSTVNGLPHDYTGKCSILLNDLDSVVVNRNLVILFALLRVGPSLDEAAEFAAHLMYSAALPSASSTYWEQCLETIYGKRCEGDMSFRVSLPTRGGTMIHSTQTAMAIREAVEMFQSHYEVREALKSMKDVAMQMGDADTEERFFSRLKPAHRLAFKRFRQTGILAPYSLNTSNFTQPNRLMFSPTGRWLGSADCSPLRGWDITAAQHAGIKHGVEYADVFGALFFHVKSQLREFARRVKDMHITIHLTQFDPRVLSKAISSGILPEFTPTGQGCFDRVQLSNLMDDVGLTECLSEWAPLLNRRNPHASILVHSRTWYVKHLNASVTAHPRLTDHLKRKCGLIQGLFGQNSQSPSLYRYIDSLDTFYDTDEAFHNYLTNQDVHSAAAKHGLSQRKINRVHSKRFGIGLHEPARRVPQLTRNEFYDLFTIGGAELPAQFLEFAVSQD